MSRYVGQHFGQPTAGPTSTAPVYDPAPTYRRSKGKIAVGIAAIILAASGGFFAGRATAPEDKVETTSPAGDSTTPSAADELVNQGILLHTSGKLDEAAALYNQALAKDAKNKFALFNLGQIAQTRGQLDAAIEKYVAVLKIDPSYGPALYNVGLAYAAKGDRSNSITNLRKALELTPNSAPVLFNLGTVLIQDGKNDEGTKLVAQAIAIDPTLKPKS